MSNQAAPQNPDSLRAKAQACFDRAEESFQRCDTDGFLSQWASNMSGQRLLREAAIAENGGVATFFRQDVTDLDGNPLVATVCNTVYGRRWRVELANGDVVWAGVDAKRESTYTNKGFRVTETEFVAEAKAIIDSPKGARGSTGAASCYVRTVPADPSIKFTGVCFLGADEEV